MTAVVSRAATIDIRADVTDAAGFELSGILSRIQKQMIALLSQFQLTQDMLSSLEASADPSSLLLVLKVERSTSLWESWFLFYDSEIGYFELS